jgi:LysM repeat protein
VAAAAPASTSNPTEFVRNKDKDVFEPIKKIKPKPKPRPYPNKEPAVAYPAAGGTGGGSLNNPQDAMVDGTYIPDPNTGGYTATYMKKPGGQQNTTPAVAGNPVYTRFKTPDAVDAEIKRFRDKGSDMRLPANQQYLANLQARKAELAGTQTRQNAEPAPATSGSVVVKPGDTLSKIAAANKTTSQAIMAANPSIKDPNKIAVGQTLKIREAVDIGRMRFLAGLAKD